MRVDLAGRVAHVGGPAGPVGAAVGRALTANGAAVVGPPDDVVPQRLDILVLDARADLAPEQAMRLARAAARRMRGGGWGRIVLIVSVLGLVPARGVSAASIAAAGLVQAARTLAMELAFDGVLVNAVAAGPLAGDPFAARIRAHVPLARAVTADDLARAVLFLTDPDNAYTTGHVLAVDGGWSAGYTRDF